jgi:hypothetical protein
MSISHAEITRKKITRGSILSMLYILSPRRCGTDHRNALLQDNPQINGEMIPASIFSWTELNRPPSLDPRPSITPCGTCLSVSPTRGRRVEGTTRDASINSRQPIERLAKAKAPRAPCRVRRALTSSRPRRARTSRPCWRTQTTLGYRTWPNHRKESASAERERDRRYAERYMRDASALAT